MVVCALGVTAAFSGEETAALPTDPVTYVLVAGDGSSVSIWTETNGVAGLQTTVTGTAPHTTPADRRDLTLP